MKAPTKPKQNYVRTIGFYLLIILAASFLIYGFTQPTNQGEQKPISEVLTAIKNDETSEVIVDGDKVIAKLKDGGEINAVKEEGESFVAYLEAAEINPQEVNFGAKDNSTSRLIGGLVTTLLPVLVLVGLFYFFFRQARGQGDNLLSFGRSKAKAFAKDKSVVKFNDVAGVTEPKQELEEVVEFLKTPEKFRSLGAKIPKGVLLVGPAGVGKTLLARAVAGEAGVPFFSIAGSEFMEMLVGVGASRVRDLFENAKKASPAIIFIDEIDSIGRQRGLGIGGGHDEREQTLNQILVEMDGFETNTNVIVMAATNRPDVLDPALLRPGRFDRRVTIDLPDRDDRKAILKVHARKKPLQDDVNLEIIAQRTPGFSGADLYSLMNEAAILAAREKRKKVGQFDIIRSIEKVMLGPERKSHVLSKKERLVTAYHEVGHALVASVLPYADPVQKISIISRGRAAGYTLKLPDEDRKMHTRKEFLDDIAMTLGGYVTEQMIFDDLTTGPSNDLQVVANLARDMVTKYGMSSLGPIALEGTGGRLIGGGVSEDRGYSPQVAKAIDDEVAKIIEEGKERAREILVKYRKALDTISKKLVEVETLEREQYEVLLKAEGVPINDVYRDARLAEEIADPTAGLVIDPSTDMDAGKEV